MFAVFYFLRIYNRKKFTICATIYLLAEFEKIIMICGDRCLTS